MPRQAHNQEQEDRKRLRDHKFQAEDERGWAGQHGQRPANEEERNYRTNRPEEGDAAERD